MGVRGLLHSLDAILELRCASNDQGSRSPRDVLRATTMKAEAVREWVPRQPFEPFEIRLSNGEIHQVRHLELAALGRHKMAVVDPDTDRFTHISLVHINSIQALQTA